jgi:endogenous inhibitor of DNA gyrase (YacG/DUF329 family)
MTEKHKLALSAGLFALTVVLVGYRLFFSGGVTTEAPGEPAESTNSYDSQAMVACPLCGRESPAEEFTPSPNGPQYLRCPECGKDVRAQEIILQTRRGYPAAKD